MENIVTIQLTEPQIGYLDIKEDTAFPLNIGIADIRDVTTKKGTFSKSIQLAGTKNNNILLNNYFDVNVQAGTFNVSKLQKCLVLQNGVPILDNAYMQLTSVKKTVNIQGVNDELVEYTVLIKDGASDFFTKLGQLELTDLKFGELNHQLTAQNIVNSFSHDYTDGYKYVLPFKETASGATPVYDLIECKPGLYEKYIFDKIFEANGYAYEWDSLTASTIQFDKTIHPYNGAEVQLDNSGYLVIANTTGATNFNLLNSSGTTGQNLVVNQQFVVPNEVQDQLNLYNPATGNYTNTVYLGPSQTISYQVDYSYELQLINNNPWPIEFTANTPTVNYKLNSMFSVKKNNNTGYSYGYVNLLNPTYPFGQTIAQGFDFATGTTVLKSGTYSATMTTPGTAVAVNDILKLFVLLSGQVNGNAGNVTSYWRRTTAPFTPTDIDFRLVITSATIRIVPNLSGLGFQSNIDMNKFVPKKIKQADYVKSILTRYNAYVETDKENFNKLIIRTRDEFYDQGNTDNWDKKHCPEKGTDIQFLPDVSNKRLILTAKQDDADPMLKGYKENVNEIYGQIEYTFTSEHVKDATTKELLTSPITIGKTSWGAVLPYLFSNGPETNLKVAIDGGNYAAYTPVVISNFTNSTVTSSTYPLISHWDAPKNASFDLNFGINDYYYYDDTGTFTNNNLFNLHWRRTISQINNGKLLTGYFKLKETDINQLKLNMKIQLLDAYWVINKIIDYDANSTEPTKVELISVDDYVVLPKFRIRIPVKPVKGDSVYNPIKEVFATNWATSSAAAGNAVINQGFGNTVQPAVQGGFVRGNYNIVGSDAFVLGDKNIVNGNKSLIVGDGNVVGDNVKNAIIIGDNFTATTDSTVYSKNLEFTGEINGITASALTQSARGNFCTSGLTTDIIQSCTDNIYMSASGSSGALSYFSIDPDGSANGNNWYYEDSFNINNIRFLGSEIRTQNADISFGGAVTRIRQFPSEIFIQAIRLTGNTSTISVSDKRISLDAEIINFNQFIPSGTSVSLLGIDSNGNLTTGTTSGGFDFCASGITVSEISACTNNNFNMYGSITFSGEMFTIVPDDGIWYNGRNNIDTNTAFGKQALVSASLVGNSNTAFGANALRANTTGNSNVGVGISALLQNTTGGSNVAVGLGALISSVSASNNTAIGTNSLRHITTSNNTAIGRDSGRLINSGANLTASTNSVFIGADTKASANGQTNQIVIGYNAIGNGSNTTTIGSSANIETYLNGRVNLNNISGTSIANLGIDSNGFIVTATTAVSLQKYTASVNLSVGNNTITHNLGTEFVTVQVWDASGELFIPNAVNTYATNSLNINVASAITGARVVIIG